jgi:hypothetical protein
MLRHLTKAVATVLAAVVPLLLLASGAGAISQVSGNFITTELVDPADLLPPAPVGCFNPKPDTKTGLLKKRELGKFKSIGTKAGGAGGTFLQLILANVDCSGTPNPCPGTASNAGGTAGKCTDTNAHQLLLNIESALLPGVPVTVAVPYTLTDGKSGFPSAAGKNKTNGNALFGALVTAAFLQPNYFLGAALLENGGVACPAPLVPPGHACRTGETYARLGFVLEFDSDLQCTSSTECSTALECRATSPRICVPVACTSDAQCAGFGGQCSCTSGGGDGECCDPLIEPACAATC